MQDFELKLNCALSQSFRATKLAQSVDLNSAEKGEHCIKIKNIDLSDFKIGLIYGASGSGKTTLAKELFKNQFINFDLPIDENKCIIDLFDEKLNTKQCQDLLIGMGLTSVPCWLKPIKVLSNGQQFRAKMALFLSKYDSFVFDEFTSVVDRITAKAISLNVQKFIKKTNKQVILISCHDDIIDWLEPDWIIDCNQQLFKKYSKKKEKILSSQLEKLKEIHGSSLASIII